MYFIVFNMYYVSHILFYLFLFKTEWPVFQYNFYFFTTIMSELLLHFIFLRISHNFYNISFYKSTQFTFNNSLVISVPTVEHFTQAFYID